MEKSNLRFNLCYQDEVIANLSPCHLILIANHVRTTIVQDQKIVSILDWESAGSLPLSEVLAGAGVDVLGMDNDEAVDEAWEWSDRIAALVGEKLMYEKERR